MSKTHWVSSADYVDGTGMVNLTFDPLYLYDIPMAIIASAWKVEILLLISKLVGS